MKSGLKSQLRIISILLGVALLQEVLAQQSWSVGTGTGGTGNYFLYPYPGTTASPGKLGLNLPNTTDPAGLQRLSIGIGSAATEWLFGQYQGSSGSLRMGAGQFTSGASPSFWSGVDFRLASSATEIGFVTSTGSTASEKMTIKSDGSIGIGTNTTTAKLDLQDASGNRTTIFNSNLAYGGGVTGSYAANKMTASYGASSTGTLTGLQVNVSNTGNGGAYAATFTGGNVGIGKTNPTSALDVVGSLAISGNLTGAAADFTGSLGVADVRFENTRTSFITATPKPAIYGSSEGGSAPFNLNNHLVIQGRSDLARSIILVTGSIPAVRYEITGTGNHIFTGPAAFSGALTASSGLSTLDGAGLSSTISSTARTMIGRSGTSLNIGENGGWTVINNRLPSGGNWVVEQNGFTKLQLNASGRFIVNTLSDHGETFQVEGNAYINGPTTITSTLTGAAANFTGSLGVADVRFDNTRASFLTATSKPAIYGSSEGGSAPFNLNNHLVIQGRSDMPRSILFVNGTTPSVRYEISGTGNHSFSGPVSTSSTLDVTGLVIATGGIQPGFGADDVGRIIRSSVNGMKIRGVTASTNDLGLFAADGTLMLRNPTGTTGLTFNTPVNMAQLDISGNQSISGDLIITNPLGTIRSNTTDGADSKSAVLTGGGGTSSIRGAYVRAFGNENAGDPGVLELLAGNVSGGRIRMHAGGDWRYELNSSGSHSFLSPVSMSSALTGTSAVFSGKAAIGYPSTPNPITAQSAELTIKSSGGWNTDYDNNLELMGGTAAKPSMRFTTVNSGVSRSAWIATDGLGSLYFGVGKNSAPASPGEIPMTITAGANVALATNPGGQVIVGSLAPTTTPGVKLNVVGNARVSGTLYASTIKTTSWGIEPTPPDYVFEKGYKLASLDHVEKFVNEKKHLPEIPSAKEIMTGGLDLADMNMKLLKKVEELTLYAISQNKRTTAQDKEIAELKKTVHAMVKTRGEKK